VVGDRTPGESGTCFDFSKPPLNPSGVELYSNRGKPATALTERRDHGIEACQDLEVIRERAVLEVRLGQERRFEEAFSEAKTIIASMPGFRSLSLERCVEQPSRYLLLVAWDESRTTPKDSAARRAMNSGGSFSITSTTRSRSSSTTRSSPKPDNSGCP